MKLAISKKLTQKTVLYVSLIVTAIADILFSCNILPNVGWWRVLKYGIIVIPISLCILIYSVYSLWKVKDKFRIELIRAVLMVFILLTLSLIKSIETGKVTIESFIQLLQIITPFVYAYIVVNELNKNTIISLMKILLGITSFGYILWLFLNFDRGMSVSISILGISSPFECSELVEVASGLGAFFIYYRKKAPFSCVIAVILNLLMAKRVLILMMIVLLVFSILNKEKESVSNKILNCSILFFIICVQGLFILYQPQNMREFANIFGVSPEMFSVSRVYRLWYCIEQGFKSFGLASTSVFLSSRNVTYLGLDMEMDFIRLTYELGIIAVIVFVYTYLKTSKNNKYCFLLILFCLLNLLMSNGIVKYLGYTYRFITIAVINYGMPSENYQMIRRKNDIDYNSNI